MSDSCKQHPEVFFKHCPACAQDAADALLGLGALRDTWREKAEALAESVAAYEAANTALREEVRSLKAERDGLADERDCLKRELTGACERLERVAIQRDEANYMLRAAQVAVVSTIGGTDNEGNPTSSVNYLQRLRALVRAERELEHLRAGKAVRHE